MKTLFKILVTLLIMNVTVEHIKAQNLVPNPSFEDTVYCPISLSDYNAVDSWFNPTLHSPDYYNSCSDSTAPFAVNVPNNFFGHQQAKEGNGYVGIGVALYNNNREYPFSSEYN